MFHFATPLANHGFGKLIVCLSTSDIKSAQDWAGRAGISRFDIQMNCTGMPGGNALAKRRSADLRKRWFLAVCLRLNRNPLTYAIRILSCCFAADSGIGFSPPGYFRRVTDIGQVVAARNSMVCIGRSIYEVSILAEVIRSSTTADRFAFRVASPSTALGQSSRSAL